MNHPQTFTEERSRAILARAAELDRVLTGQLTPAELKDVAAQAGISEAAIEAALTEARAELDGAVQVAASARGQRHAVFALLLAAAAGALLGAAPGLAVPSFAVPIDPDGDAARAALVLGAVCTLVALFRDSKDMKRLQLGSIAAWAGFLIGGMLGFANYWYPDIGLVGVIGAAGSAAATGAIVWARQRWSSIRTLLTTPASTS